MKHHFLNHLCGDLEQFCSIQLLEATPYEHLNAAFKRAYFSKSKKTVTRVWDMASALNSIVDGLRSKRRDGYIIVQPLLKAKRMQAVEEALCLLSREGWQIMLNKLSR